MDGSSSRWSSKVRAPPAELSTDAKRNWMDTKIREMEEDILDMKAFRNSLSPFTSLPNELIVEIIVHSQVADLKRDLEWLKLTHVCRHWRAVALSTPRLWIELRIRKNMPSMDAILQRSEDAKLHVSSAPTSLMLSKTTEMILRAHAARIYHLRICFSPHRCNLKDVRFSIMESLQVGDGYHEDSDDENDVDGQADANFDFVHDSTRFPRLRILSLKNMAFPRPSQVLTSLVHLELSNLYDPPSSIDALLDTLESMCHLEFLKINRCQLSFATAHAKPLRTVSLSSLRRLCLGDEPLNLAFILPRLVIPPDASLQLEVILPDADSGEDDLIIAALRDKSCIPNFSVLRNVRIRFSGYGFYCDADIRDVVVNFPPFQLSLGGYTIIYGFEWIHDRRPIHEVGKLFSALSVTRLDLASTASMVATEYRSLLQGFPHVDHLTISTDDIVPFLVALGTKTADSHVEPLCQKLRTLVVKGTYLKEDSDVHAQVIPALLNALRSRASSGVVLEQLILHHFVDAIRNKAEVVAELEGLVSVLKFDVLLRLSTRHWAHPGT